MFIKKCDFKCIKILAKCDTRTEYVYCCHFTITCLSCEKYINLVIPMLRLFTKPEALKSLYRSPGYKKKQLVLCKNYVLQW